MMISTSIPSIPLFFTGKNIFITGATGFLGKALIEKLLRSCPHIGDIYVLVRPKRGKQLTERIAGLVADPLYERLKKEQPNLVIEDKIKPLAGDVVQLNLGLSPEDRQTIVDNVHIIFHVAASVRFDDCLTDAVMMNVRGTREACQLALDTKKLVAHIHVSTAFVNCDRTEATEVLYPAKISWKKMIEIAEKFDKMTLTALTEQLMNGMPNTYCFTKHIAEHVAFDMLNGKKPCKIFRPSIVIGTMHNEPVTGWIDNFNGPIGILVAFGKGIMRTTYANNKYKPDYIPADVVTKALVVSTWDLAIRHTPPLTIPCTPEVLHCTSHKYAEWIRPSIESLAKTGTKVNQRIPFNDILWVPSKHTTNSIFIWYLRTVLFMLFPSFILDSLLKLMGKKPILMKLQKKMFVAQTSLRYFMNNEWDYNNENLVALLDRIKISDKEHWNYDFKDFDFEVYIENCIIGCRRYLLKESDATLPQAKKHFKRMTYVHKITQLIGIGLVFWLLLNVGVMNYGFQKIRNVA